jgi:hypothetical protein
MTLYNVNDHKELARFFENYEHIAIAPMTRKVGQKTCSSEGEFREFRLLAVWCG